MNRRQSPLVIAIAIMAVVLTVAYNQGWLSLVVLSPTLPTEHMGGTYYSMVDGSGVTIMQTSYPMAVGDQYLNEDNKLYEVERVDGQTAHARFVEQVDMSQYLAGIDLEAVQAAMSGAAPNQGTIAVYSTHTDESYIKGDGAESKKGNGGILDVAASFANALKQKGFNVVHSTAKHDPHDEGAYNRSRRTVSSLLKQQPLAVFDVHRDAAVPPEQYVGQVNGEQVTKVRLVVGRQNPKRSVNDAFAKQLKAVGDKVQPGLMKGIFYARGNYNQDLSNKAMLLELGTEKNNKDHAEKGIAAFANVVAATLGAQTTPGAPGGTTRAPGGGAPNAPRNTASPGAGRAVATLIGLAVLGGIGFLAISAGGFKEMGGKLKQLGSSEFASFLGRFRKKKGND